MKRLLVLAPAPGLAASTRFRLQQFFPALQDAGIQPVLRPFLDEVGFQVLYSRGAARTKAIAAANALAGRLADVVKSTRVDGVLIHREAALVGPPVVEWLLTQVLRLPIVFDFDDAVWVPYESPTYGERLSRLLKWPQKTDFSLRAARHVIAGNNYLAEYARRFNPAVTIIPTVVDTEIFKPAPRSNPVPVVGWIGTHSSARYLKNIVGALQRLARTHDFVLRAHGGTLDAPGVRVENLPWSLASEVADFQSLDVGLYPLVEEAWSLGKSGFKAVQYMACGTALVASPVGVTREMIRHGDNGFLATSEDEWVDCLSTLLDDPARRQRMGAAGRQDAIDKWSLASRRDSFVRVIADALAG